MQALVAVVFMSAAAITGSGNEWAYGHWNKLADIAYAFAIQQRCSSLSVDTKILLKISSDYRIRWAVGSTDLSAMTSMMKKRVSTLEGQPSESICALGRDFFGPSGVRAKNLLIAK